MTTAADKLKQIAEARDAYKRRFEPTDDAGSPTGEKVLQDLTADAREHLTEIEEALLKAQSPRTLAPLGMGNDAEEEERRIRDAVADAERRGIEQARKRTEDLLLCSTMGHVWRLDGAGLDEIACRRCGTAGAVVARDEAVLLARIKTQGFAKAVGGR